MNSKAVEIEEMRTFINDGLNFCAYVLKAILYQKFFGQFRKPFSCPFLLLLIAKEGLYNRIEALIFDKVEHITDSALEE
jgi:hypothetical protein